MLRKAGQLIKANPIPSALVGTGSILGLLGALRSLSKPEQEVVLEAAAEAEASGVETAVTGLGGTGLMAAGAMLAMMEDDDDLDIVIDRPIDLSVYGSQDVTPTLIRR